MKSEFEKLNIQIDWEMRKVLRLIKDGKAQETLKILRKVDLKIKELIALDMEAHPQLEGKSNES